MPARSSPESPDPPMAPMVLTLMIYIGATNTALIRDMLILYWNLYKVTLIVLEGFTSLAHEEHVGRQSLVKISTFGLVEVVWSKGN